MKNNGQSLIEVVFSIGLIMLVMTGVVILLLNTINARTKSYDRNKAVELSQIVMEDIVKTEASDPTSFWDLASTYWNNLATPPKTNTNFPDYTYNATVAQYSGSGCSASKVECVNVIITINNWKNGNVNNQFNRFFSKK